MSDEINSGNDNQTLEINTARVVIDGSGFAAPGSGSEDSNQADAEGNGDINLDDAMGIINSNHALTPLAPEQVYVFRMTLSNQARDSYQTRMAMSTLNNYA